ncbi:hypothetical protein DE146DRAFT_622847 [Phaeosphaeria sp. MPI-PUGE-AT-0046c]|nr:hypothetical protein DE146DRAFT_622847 [Phaeosphaeria sp. MPI-PUGE-AT-0046c]
MASKSSSPGPNATTTTPAPKQARSRKAAPPQAEVGRAGSAGGIVLEREKEKKPKKPSTASKPAPVQEAVDNAASKTPKRKPRKLNKEPTSTTPASASKDTATPIEPPTATEIEALKSRVRGLEAKVEELYKSGSLDRSGRSPRRRGKGRKSSSQQQVPTLSNVNVKAKSPEIDDDVEEIGRGNVVEDTDDQDDELVRLEGELEVARQDLAAFRPRSRRANTKTQADDDDDEEDVEDLPRDDTSPSSAGNRHVTLSGSYRIPLPASVSVDDVRNIQSGVSAAQNVARSFLEQRRAAGAKQPASARPAPKSVSSSMEIAEVGGGKQSWSEWIGGYSVAISRAVKNIEHEAAVESQAAGNSRGAGGGGGTKKKGSNAAGKRPGVKTKMSGEQVDGLMS